jgi:hypothetical protein
MDITIRLLKPAKNRTITYPGQLVRRTETRLLVRTVWTQEMGRVDLGPVTFEPGDYLYEYFYADRWYNVFELHAPDSRLKGWYCNITRPALLSATSIESEDLELDLFVSPARDKLLVLDEDEYNALGLAEHDPPAHEAAHAALHELQMLARRGAGPFAGIEGREVQ